MNGIDLTGADAALAKELEIAAADNLKRVFRPLVSRDHAEKEAKGADRPQAVDGVDWSADPGTHRLTAFLETKTVWHPTGALGVSGSSY